MFKILHITFTMMAMLFVHMADATLINIIDDYTYANSQVTYTSGVVSTGTTKNEFSEALFPSATFSGYDINIEPIATVKFTDGSTDSVSFNAYNKAMSNGNTYQFITGLQPSGMSLDGVKGNASSKTKLKLKFQVSDGDTSMYMYISNESSRTQHLKLYDETLNMVVANLTTNLWVDEISNVNLYNNHVYSLTGSLYVYTDFLGDPRSEFGFRFNDGITLTRVSEPSTLAIMLFMLIALAISRKHLIS